MESPRAAAVYARISSDVTGEQLGVARQVEDCRRLAAARGWVVAEEYVDNDVSAFRGKSRPAYQRMLADLADGLRDAVVVYNLDRLTRRPIELEEFTILCEKAGVTQVATVTSDFNLGNDDGLFMARITAAVAAKESGRKSERLRRKHEQLAEQGRPNGGYMRPYGYGPDRLTVVESEAHVIRDLVARYVAGESLRSLAAWLNAEEVAPVGGGQWRTPTLRAMVSSGRIAGLREHHGQVVGAAVWPAIITPAQRAQVLARMTAGTVTGRRTPRRYVLSGLLRCGKCGGRLYSSARGDRRRYVCMAGPDHGGCGRLTVVAPPVEELVAAAVLFRLDTPEFADALAGRAATDAQHAALVAELQADRSQREELARMWSDRAITSEEWRAAREPLDKRIRDAERRLERTGPAPALAGWVGNASELGDRWASLNLERQAAIIAAVLDHAVIGPGTPGARSLDPERVHPVWRL